MLWDHSLNPVFALIVLRIVQFAPMKIPAFNVQLEFLMELFVPIVAILEVPLTITKFANHATYLVEAAPL